MLDVQTIIHLIQTSSISNWIVQLYILNYLRVKNAYAKKSKRTENFKFNLYCQNEILLNTKWKKSEIWRWSVSSSIPLNYKKHHFRSRLILQLKYLLFIRFGATIKSELYREIFMKGYTSLIQFQKREHKDKCMICHSTRVNWSLILLPEFEGLSTKQ